MHVSNHDIIISFYINLLVLRGTLTDLVEKNNVVDCVKQKEVILEYLTVAICFTVVNEVSLTEI